MASYEGLKGGEKSAKSINENRSSKGLKPTTQEFPF